MYTPGGTVRTIEEEKKKKTTGEGQYLIHQTLLVNKKKQSEDCLYYGQLHGGFWMAYADKQMPAGNGYTTMAWIVY